MITIKNLKELFENVNKLTVPSYQRAYAWEEEQLKQFISDMLEISGKENRNYYFGHFILEETEEYFEIIDGQQRITTFILFLMVCKLFNNDGSLDQYINKFDTVDYDKQTFKLIQQKLKDSNDNWEISSFELSETEQQTLSIQRILVALNYFRKLFKDGKQLHINKIENYIETFKDAAISTHIAKSKAVAVQIFELQNTRGLKLNLIEKVKSKLMKAVYLNAESNEAEDKILIIQKEFARIYQLEEQVNSNVFRGELALEDILFHHLRIIDDGSKLSTNDKNLFNEPSKYGNKEEAILNYIDKQISEKQNVDIVNYIIKLVTKFKSTVEFVSNYLPKKDEINRLIGDVLILDKSLSLEFFILLYHKELKESIENVELIRLWEKFLYTRDFHDKYYRQVYRDDFERMYYDITKNIDSTSIILTLNRYVLEGFRKDKMENENLPTTVANYIKNNESFIFNNAYHWWNEKIVYLLYKYEIKNGANLNELRKVMKEGRSLEHILPQEWKWVWIGENLKELSEEGKEFNKKISNTINGLGNLILVTGSENSSLNNSHPKDKKYISCSGGSYKIHNENKEQWGEHLNWEKLIQERGKNIYKFLNYFIE